MSEACPPPPQLQVRPGIWLGDEQARLRLRRHYIEDGDYTNAIISLGVRLEREVVDLGEWSTLVEFGFDLIVPPRLFWLLNLFRSYP